MLRYLAALLLAATTASAQVPFEFTGSSGAERQQAKIYGPNGDTRGLNWTCRSTPPIPEADADRVVCYCDSDTDLFLCSINGGDYDSLVFAESIETLVFDFETITIADNSAGSFASGTLFDPITQHTTYNVGCSDTQGCNLDLPATGVNGWSITVIYVQPFTGIPLVLVPDAVQHIMADGGWAADNGDTISFVWRPSAWFETSRSVNHTDSDGQQIDVADNGGGTKATFAFNPFHQFIVISCLDTQGCEPSSVTNTYGWPGRIVNIVTANNTVTFNDIANLSVTGSSIDVTPLQNVSLLFRGGEWIQHTAVLP